MSGITNINQDEDDYIVPIDKVYPFYFSEEFLSEYKDKEVPWGYGDLSYVTFKRTYARDIEDEDRSEEWWETCKRVIEYMFTVQKSHCNMLNTPWDNRKAQESAKEAYDRMFNMKWLPPGRGLWNMGTEYTKKRTGACLNNCAFTSTKNIDTKFSEPFVWMMSMSMLGVGVGFDTRGKEKVRIVEPQNTDEAFVVPDSKEGWCAAVEKFLDAHVGECKLPEFDYSDIREKGEPIETFGGIAPGPEPLKKCIKTLDKVYEGYIGEKVDAELIVDTMNIIGRCVVSGGLRRSAQIALGDKGNEEYLDLKQDQEKVSEYRWASNNSVFVEVGDDYEDIVDRTKDNGEPGYMWLENAQQYGRMKDRADGDDDNVLGVNPCGEQPLEDRELCCLVETFPAHHDSLEDFKETLKYAYQYAKTVTLIPTHDQRTNSVMLSNRRIGCSVSGIVQAAKKHGRNNLFQWFDKGYEYIQHLDKKYSNWLCVQESIKTTSCKPSGTVSILAGSTPGVHWDHSPYYIRRVRIHDSSPLIEKLKEANYPIEEAKYEDDTVVVEFPVKVDNIDRGKRDVSIWEKMELVAAVQYYWSDNAVSATISFEDEEAEEIPRILEFFEDRLKTISFLPSEDHGYEQAPYEEIGKEEYIKRKERLNSITIEEDVHDQEDKFCDGEACEIDVFDD